MAKIFLTGITGFLGSNIAEFLIEHGHCVVAVYRLGSSRELCENYLDKVSWIILDENDKWVDEVIEKRPDVVVHSAWIGVGHKDRDDWQVQFLNIGFLEKLLLIAGKSSATKFIGLGSQAEYGVFDGCVDEMHQLNAKDAYGSVKIICSEIVKRYSGAHEFDWYWLRLFSFFGKGESENWLIPSLVKKILSGDHMDLTAGEQKYAYLYVNDLGVAINNIIINNGISGFYNISGKTLIPLKYLVENIKEKINPSFKLNFGILPYRTNQSMHLQGDPSKFIEEFGEFEVSDFDGSLLRTIEYLKDKFKIQINESI